MFGIPCTQTPPVRSADNPERQRFTRMNEFSFGQRVILLRHPHLEAFVTRPLLRWAPGQLQIVDETGVDWTIWPHEIRGLTESCHSTDSVATVADAPVDGLVSELRTPDMSGRGSSSEGPGQPGPSAFEEALATHSWQWVEGVAGGDCIEFCNRCDRYKDDCVPNKHHDVIGCSK